MEINLMEVNPYNSPILQKLHNRRMIEIVKRHVPLLNICKHFKQFYIFKDINDMHGYIKVNNEFFITSKKTTKMRMISRLDWVHYKPQDLALAIQTNTVEQYYAQQLNDPASDPNIWYNTLEEYDLKEYYANRVNRKLDALDNL